MNLVEWSDFVLLKYVMCCRRLSMSFGFELQNELTGITLARSHLASKFRCCILDFLESFPASKES